MGTADGNEVSFSNTDLGIEVTQPGDFVVSDPSVSSQVTAGNSSEDFGVCASQKIGP